MNELPMFSKRTKIVATIGPASEKEDVLRQMIRGGLNVARINFSHGTYEEHARRIETVRRVAASEGRVVALLADFQGPKLRLGKFETTFRMLKGDRVTLTSRPDFDEKARIFPLPHPDLVLDVQAGERLIIGDGDLQLLVVEKPNATDLVCEALTNFQFEQRKGVNAPDSRLTLPAITDKDMEDVAFAVSYHFDWYAMSFVRNAEDIRSLRNLLIQHGIRRSNIVAKIEMREALSSERNLEEIIAETDGVMVARGDLGIELDIEELPIWQKKIVYRANLAGKPVIVATEMLKGMEKNPRPSRAEVSDVANAIFDGADAVMLSGETSTGEYPLQAVQTMAKVAAHAEANLREFGKTHIFNMPVGNDASVDNYTYQDKNPLSADAVSRAAVIVAERNAAKLIVCSTTSGYTAKRVARRRPSMPILCITPRLDTRDMLALVWGVESVLVDDYRDRSIDDMFHIAEQAAIAYGGVESGDLIVIVSGVPFGPGGATNLIKLHPIP
jgi:pyruvate kinase